MAKTDSSIGEKRNYLFISKGKFYETAKSLLPGYVEHKYTFAKEERISYRKYYDDITGKITYLGFDKDKFDKSSWNMIIVMEDGDDIDQITIPWKYQKGSVNLYARNLIARLENLIFDGSPVTLSPFEFNITDDEGNEKFVIGVTVINAGEKVEATYYENVPTPVTTKNDVGEDVQDYTDQNKFYHTKLMELIEKFKASGGPVVREKKQPEPVKKQPANGKKPAAKTPTPAASAKQPPAVKTVDVTDVDDDLPF